MAAAAAWAALLQDCGKGLPGSGADGADEVPADLADAARDDMAARLRARYAPFLVGQDSRPLVIAQLGQSLDGRIATASGHSHFVTGPADRTHLHRLRALCDGVLVGAGTVQADNPRLTVRAVAGANPRRIVVSQRSGLADDRHLFTDGLAPTLVMGPAWTEVPSGIPRLDPGALTPPELLAALAGTGIRRLLVEGGARTVSAWLAAGLVDHLYMTLAPVIIGAGPSGLQLPAIERMEEALRPAVAQFPLGEDRLFRLDFSAVAA